MNCGDLITGRRNGAGPSCAGSSPPTRTSAAGVPATPEAERAWTGPGSRPALPPGSQRARKRGFLRRRRIRARRLDGRQTLLTKFANGLVPGTIPEPSRRRIRWRPYSGVVPDAARGTRPEECALGLRSGRGVRLNDVQYNMIWSETIARWTMSSCSGRGLVSSCGSGARNTPLYVISLTHHNLLPVEIRRAHLAGTRMTSGVAFPAAHAGGPSSACKPLSPLCVTNHSSPKTRWALHRTRRGC